MSVTEKNAETLTATNKTTKLQFIQIFKYTDNKKCLSF